MKHLVKSLFVAAFAGAATLVSAGDNADHAEIEALRAQVQELRNRVQQTETATQNLDAMAREARLLQASYAQAGQAGAVSLAGSSALTISGDLRLRWERISSSIRGDVPTEVEGTPVDINVPGRSFSRDQLLTRVRLGLDYVVDANTSIHIQLAGGDHAGNNTNYVQGSGGAFSKSGVNFEYAYARHTWGDVTLALGQQPHVFTTTDHLFDPDNRPAGLSVQYLAGEDALDFFANVGAYKVMTNDGVEDAVSWYGAQVGIRPQFEGMGMTLALSYAGMGHLHAHREAHMLDDGWQVRQGDIYADLHGMVGDFNVKAFGQYLKNFGAEGDDKEDKAWVLGFAVGYEMDNDSSVGLHYSYAVIEADATLDALTDNEFRVGRGGYMAALHDAFADAGLANGMINPEGTSMGIKGHRVGVTYAITRNVAIGVTGTFTKPKGNLMDGMQSKETAWQFDISYNF